MSKITACDILSIDENAEILLETGEADSRMQWVTLVDGDGQRLFAVTTNGGSIFDSDDEYSDAIAEFDADAVRETLQGYAD